MPCSATITARGGPSASQWRMGNLVPSRATITSSVTMGVTPPSVRGAKVGAQAHRRKSEKDRTTRTLHSQTLRHGRIGLVAQDQLARHHNMIHERLIAAKRQDRAFIIDK